MPKPYDHRTLLGVVQISYNESGLAQTATFKPVEFDVPPKAINELCKVVPKANANSIKNTELIIAQWLLSIDAIETSDRESSKLETKTIKCEFWPDSTPKTQSIEVWFATTT